MKKALFTLVCSAFFSSSSSKPDMSRLRLAAACALLKLAQEPCYHEIITLEQYQLCALVINVRTTFLKMFSHIVFTWGTAFSHYILYKRTSTPRILPLCISLRHFTIRLFLIIIVTFFCVFLFSVRMSATRCGSVFPRSYTGAYVASVCPWNTWRFLLCVPRTLLKRGGLTLASAWWKMSTYAESTSSSTLPSAVKILNNQSLDSMQIFIYLQKQLLSYQSMLLYCHNVLDAKGTVRMSHQSSDRKMLI